jgi:hypothetical protein
MIEEKQRMTRELNLDIISIRKAEVYEFKIKIEIKTVDI